MSQDRQVVLPGGFRPASAGETDRADPDMVGPFGSFAPNAAQRALIGLARSSFLHRGLFRRTMTRLIMGLSQGPLDIDFRGCAFRLREANNLIEYGLLLSPDYNRPDIEFLLGDLPKDGVFVDVGANIGLYTLPLARKLFPEGRAVAIDANPLMARRLAWNAAASGLDNIAVFACAVSDREGAGVLNVRKDDVAIVAVEEREGGGIPVRTLAALLAEAGVSRVDALKIDIEGHEDKALPPFLDAASEAMLPRRIVIERPFADADYPACTAAFARRGYRLQGRTKTNSLYLRES